MGDEDNGHPLLPEGAHEAEEGLRLSLTESRGGLIHDDDIGIKGEGLGHLYHLALGDG